MSLLAMVTGYLRRRRANRQRWRTEMLIRNLPYEVQSDIGWAAGRTIRPTLDQSRQDSLWERRW